MAYLVAEMNHLCRRIWKPAAIETTLHAISEFLLSMLLFLFMYSRKEQTARL